MNQHFDERLDEIGRQMTRLKASRTGRRLNIPEDIRVEVLELLKKGYGTTELARRLGMRPSMVSKWKRQERGAGFRALSVVEQRTTGEFILRSPSGWEIKGLKVEDLARLFRDGSLK